MLMGSARSGTTWLAEVIDRHHDHRLIFEPLRPDTVPELSVFSEGQYLRPDVDDSRYEHAMSDLLNGRIRNPWADHLNSVKLPRQRLIKEIRGNLLVPWLLRQFPGTPVILIVRHPLAVEMSRRSLGWKDHLGSALAQPDLISDHLADVVEQLTAMTDPFERQLAKWSIENLVPLRMTTPDHLCVVSYEQLITDPLPAVERVLAHLGQVASHLRIGVAEQGREYTQAAAHRPHPRLCRFDQFSGRFRALRPQSTACPRPSFWRYRFPC